MSATTRPRAPGRTNRPPSRHVGGLLLPDAARLHHGRVVQNSCNGNKQTGGDRVEDAENRDNSRAERNRLAHRETAADGEIAVHRAGQQAGRSCGSVLSGEGRFRGRAAGA